MCLKCRDLRAGMRISNRVVQRNIIIAEKGDVLSEVLIRLILFVGVKRVRVDDVLSKSGARISLAAIRS